MTSDDPRWPFDPYTGLICSSTVEFLPHIIWKSTNLLFFLFFSLYAKVYIFRARLSFVEIWL